MNFNEFVKILRRYRMGEATQAEIALVEQWYDLIDEQYIQSNKIDENMVEERIWEKLEFDLKSTGSSNRNWRRKVFRMTNSPAKALIAALFIGVFIWYGLYYSSSTSPKILAESDYKTEELVIYENDLTIVKEIQLSDRSRIRLSPGAILKVPVKFQDKRREVFLEGEAFFDIAKNPKHPFYVYTGSITTHVLGTSFNIKPIASAGQIEVSVVTGRVEVFETNEEKSNNKLAMNSKGVVLTPNQRMIYHKQTRTFEAGIVNDPIPVKVEDQQITTSPKFIFNETNLREVLVDLETTYGIEMIVENKGIYDCPFTGDISRQNLFQKLDIINLVLGTTYEVKGTRILIKGNGCE